MNTAKTVIRQEKKDNNRIILLTMALFFTGIVFILSSSSAGLIMNGSNDPAAFMKKQLLFGAIAFTVGFIIYKTPLKLILENLNLIQIFTIILMLSVFVIGKEVNGNKNWLQFGPFSIQPSEFAKITLIFLAAKVLGNNDVNDKETLKKLAITVLPILLIVVAQKDLGTAMIMGAIVLAMMYLSGLKPKTLLMFIGAGILGVLALSIASPYRMKRMLIFTNPFRDYYGMGYQIVQGIYAAANGGLFGQGIGNSIHKYGFLPENHTDFIFAVVAEEIGFIGGALVIILFVLLVANMLKVAFKIKNKQLSLTCAGIASFIAIESLMNLGVVVSLMPVTGVTLPFISYGGSSVISKILCVSLVLNINKSSRKIDAEDLDRELQENNRRRYENNRNFRNNVYTFTTNSYNSVRNFSTNIITNTAKGSKAIAITVKDTLSRNKSQFTNVKSNISSKKSKFKSSKNSKSKFKKISTTKSKSNTIKQDNLDFINLDQVYFNESNFKNQNIQQSNDEELNEIDLNTFDVKKFNK